MKLLPTVSWNLWGCEFKLLKPDAYPIKTYIDFGLDKDPKEEFKVDPISPVIELFGSIGERRTNVDANCCYSFQKSSNIQNHAYFWQKSHDWVKEGK